MHTGHHINPLDRHLHTANIPPVLRLCMKLILRKAFVPSLDIQYTMQPMKAQRIQAFAASKPGVRDDDFLLSEVRLH